MKKGLAAILSLVLTIGMTVPAMAARPTAEEALECIEVRTSVEEELGVDDLSVKKPFRLGVYDPELPENPLHEYGPNKFTEYDEYGAIRKDSKIKVTNTAPKGKNVYLRVELQCYVNEYYIYGSEKPEGNIWVNSVVGGNTKIDTITLEEGTYTCFGEPEFPSQLSENGFVPLVYGEWIEIQPGETAEFDFVKDIEDIGTIKAFESNGDDIFEVKVYAYFPDEECYWGFRYLFHVDEEAVDNFQLSQEQVEPVLMPNPGERITFDGGFLSDSSYHYNYVLQNETEEKMEGYYALVTVPASNESQAQIFPFAIALNPGETMRGGVHSYNSGLSTAENYWIEFESKEEFDAYFAQDKLIANALGMKGTGYTFENESAMLQEFGITR